MLWILAGCANTDTGTDTDTDTDTGNLTLTSGGWNSHVGDVYVAIVRDEAVVTRGVATISDDYRWTVSLDVDDGRYVAYLHSMDGPMCTRPAWVVGPFDVVGMTTVVFDARSIAPDGMPCRYQ